MHRGATECKGGGEAGHRIVKWRFVMIAPHSPEILKHRESLLGHIRSIVREPAEAEDVLQETLVRAHRTFEQLRDDSALPTWLFRIATHLSLDHLRHRSRRPQVQECELDEIRDEDGAPSLEGLMEQREMSACVQRYLLELPVDYRTVILLHDLEGLTAAEVAAVLEISLANAKVRLHRARERLKEALVAGCKFSCDCRGVFVCEPKTD